MQNAAIKSVNVSSLKTGSAQQKKSKKTDRRSNFGKRFLSSCMEFQSPTSRPTRSDVVLNHHPPFPIIHQFLLPPPPLPTPSTVLLPVPFNPSLFFTMDNQRSISLLQFMVDEGLVPSVEEEDKRKSVIRKLKQVVSSWIKKVACLHQLPDHQIAVTSATVLTYGSYGLGVHSSGSDIDALCVAPFFASIAEDFFIVLHDMLKRRPEVSYIHCVKSAKVPLMRFKFEGVSIDLPYARLNVLYVPENVDILNPFFMRNIDDTSWKSLSGVRANKYILHLVPNIEKFQCILRCLKLWAKRRGVYGTLLGYLGGVHMTVLAAYVFLRHPDATLNALIMHFFQTFAFWPWPTPVMLQEGMLTVIDGIETRSYMPIFLPSSRYEHCHTSITKSTFFRIRSEFLRGHEMTKDILKPDFLWDNVFEPFPYTERYSRFLKICLSSPNHYALVEWVGWVKSRFRGLLLHLEATQGFCDPNPTEYVDSEKTEPNVIFYWGLKSNKNNFLDIDSVKGEFMKIIKNGYEGSPGRMEMSILLASQLPN
ncbi:nuclear poly(A) polymerase 3 isoform X1 [Vigna radiata var. radiata]|uniref:polynucleotide adenylyltransferase n=1 Tax=Vigna radiata var. radiata TaxID=3916 RepID=A0A1S3VIF1_VIGRR|nr:nuclear poly(A) polymerase 3 isoform X1 [Vigna radiata var. radiata]